MSLQVDEKRYFLKKSGRITGPFPLIKLKAMYNGNMLTCEDMYSEDKCQWQSVSVLFPALQPALPETNAHVESAPVFTGSNTGSYQPEPPEAPGRQNRAPADLPAEPPSEPLHPAVLLLQDVGRTFALLWNFQGVSEKYSDRAPFVYVISLMIHIVWSAVLVLFFGRYSSTGFHWVFSPLMGVCLLLILFGAASLAGWIEVKCCTPANENVSCVWMLCAAGFYMTFGTLACSVIALLPALYNHQWVFLVLFFINTALACSGAMQFRDYLERQGKNWKIVVICDILLINPAVAAIIYGFTKLI